MADPGGPEGQTRQKQLGTLAVLALVLVAFSVLDLSGNGAVNGGVSAQKEVPKPKFAATMGPTIKFLFW